MADDQKHNLHPSITNAAQNRIVSNSPFKNNNAQTLQHPTHPSLDAISNAVDAAKQSLDNLKQQNDDDDDNDKKDDKTDQKVVHTHQASVYVLDDAKLAAKGIDFWQNNRTHSRVNTEWWLNQLKMRKELNKKTSIPSSPKKSGLITISGGINNNNNYKYNDKSLPSVLPDDDDDIENSVVYHNDHDVISPPSRIQTVRFADDIADGNDNDDDDDDDDEEEFKTLLADYRNASKQLLKSEKEKQENMITLNKQKSLISSQNSKIVELERQLNIFNNINISNEKNQKLLFEKLENNLAATKDIENRIRVNITKQITEKVNQNYNQKINENINKNNNQNMDDINALKKEISELKMQNKIRDLKLNKYTDELNDKNIELNSMKDAMIKKQNDFIDKMKNQQNIRNKLKDVQYENQNLFKNINDLKSELELERERIRQQQRVNNDNDDIKQQDDDVTKPLITNRISRTPRNNDNIQKKYIALPPKEYVLKRQWCCGLVCCNNACGLGSY